MISSGKVFGAFFSWRVAMYLPAKRMGAQSIVSIPSLTPLAPLTNVLEAGGAIVRHFVEKDAVHFIALLSALISS